MRGSLTPLFFANLSEQLLYWFTHLDIYLKHTRELARVPEGSLHTKTLPPVNILRRDQNNLVSAISKTKYLLFPLSLANLIPLLESLFLSR